MVEERKLEVVKEKKPFHKSIFYYDPKKLHLELLQKIAIEESTTTKRWPETHDVTIHYHSSKAECDSHMHESYPAQKEESTTDLEERKDEKWVVVTVEDKSRVPLPDEYKNARIDDSVGDYIDKSGLRNGDLR